MNENINQFSGSIIDLHLHNHLDFVKIAKLWNLEEYQIQDGPFEAIVKAIHTPFIQLGYVSRSSGVVLKGIPPKNCYVFGYLDVLNEGTVSHNGLVMNPNELLVLEEKDQIDVLSSHGYNTLTVAIQKKHFDREYRDCFNDSFTYDKVNKRIQLNKNMGTHLKQALLKVLAHAIKDPVKLREDTEFLQDIEKRIIQILFQSIDTEGKTKSPLDSEKQANIIRIYLNLHLTEELTLQQISQDLHMSDRTIRKGFNKLFGMNPKKYLLNYRLGKIHNVLLKSDLAKVTIQEIANDHGIYHMGHFPRQYREMFGEKPLDTLKRSS